MYKIGAGDLPPLPDTDQISELAIDFILCCLTLSADERPTADELMSHHQWVVSYLQYRDQMDEPLYDGGTDIYAEPLQGEAYDDDLYDGEADHNAADMETPAGVAMNERGGLQSPSLLS